MNITNVVHKGTGRISPAEIRNLDEGKLITAHRDWDTAHIVLQEFTTYNGGLWENDEYTCKFDSIEDANKAEKIVRVSKK